MQNDSQIYVDPEEDEVFFGCVSEREKSISAKLLKYAVISTSDECKLNKVLDERAVNVDGDIQNISRNEQSTGSVCFSTHGEKLERTVEKNGGWNSFKRRFREYKLGPSQDEVGRAASGSEARKEVNEAVDSAQVPDEEIDPFEKVPDSNEILSNTSVELEHNYSTPMKHKIDRSILATPKSIVKADKDGGFLKVLSEIALVKAEAEGESKREDEDKENKMSSGIPEIKVTEATPEKGVTSPPKPASTDVRRFRIIYNSPRNEDNVAHKSKSTVVESFESERNFKNKRLDQEMEILESHKRKSIDMIDFSESSVLPGGEETRNSEEKKEREGVEEEAKHAGAADEKVKMDVKIHPRPPATLRFSKEARKVIEVLKSSSADDTLNFTIPELDAEEEENSFLSPEPVSAFDETVVPLQNTDRSQPKSASPMIPTRHGVEAKTAEKERSVRTPLASQPKFHPVKCFSERKLCNQIGGEGRKCAKKLPLEEKRPATVEKSNGISQQSPLSRIPVFGSGSKNPKKHLFERIARPAQVKTTPSKMTSVKSFKNPKFNHIESPINAYIHNKPTTLVLNVKSEGRKESVTKVWKSQTTGSAKKVQEKFPKEQEPSCAIKLPFVEYKSATPYKIEKQPESRLPRLAPSVMKLIGSHSPKVLRHEGRFYMNSPRKENSTENTIVAEPNEVSVVVSQPAQKSHTIK